MYDRFTPEALKTLLVLKTKKIVGVLSILEISFAR
jgi:hypothetical protein